MQAERDERAIERVALERQLVRLTGALIVARDRIGMLVADVEHRQRLIDADDAPAFEMFGQWTSDPPGAGGEIENQFVAFQRQHLDQFFRQGAAHAGERSPIKLGGVSWIVKAGFVLVAVFMVVGMLMRVIMAVIVNVAVIVPMPVFMIVLLMIMPLFVAMRVLMWMIMTVVVCMTVLVIMCVIVLVSVRMPVIVLSFVSHGIQFSRS